MVSLNTILPIFLTLSSSILSFQLIYDKEGYAILPPTDVVLKELKESGKKDSTNHYDVLTTIHKNGEIIHINLHSHDIKQTGKYKYDYDNSIYNDNTSESETAEKRTIEDSDLKQCFNKDFELETSQCGFKFIGYDDATNCDTTKSTKYSCVLDVMKQQDATLKLKDMDDVPAQVRCYHKLSLAQSNEVVGGACAD
ncbi:uncharacterized protein KGF55_001818 [Candida pseudojiufengensis]|uniref:uncharacterized protein n=1 Tax=Candida pseudojiufengensis TaxID=497109 RepID=UPI0022248C52|nr:uncharacterized protein KGF55_001818 [Candida pseudojiufengensis]KAI5964748.1 hypothetical protein KGF55_001818 [Candida pseudojiufengensis]